MLHGWWTASTAPRAPTADSSHRRCSTSSPLTWVPTCRMMIPPACTSWPPYTLTPRRLGFESRPFLVEPDPILWAFSTTKARRGATAMSGRADTVWPRKAEVEREASMVPGCLDSGGGAGLGGGETQAGAATSCRACVFFWLAAADRWQGASHPRPRAREGLPLVATNLPHCSGDKGARGVARGF